jgi:hypothetical protein
MAGVQAAGVRGNRRKDETLTCLRAFGRQPWQETGIQRPLMGVDLFTAPADCRWGGCLRLTAGIAANGDAGMAFELPDGIEQKIAPLRSREMRQIAFELGRQLIERTIVRPEKALRSALQGFAAAEYAVFVRLEMLGAGGVVDEFALPLETKDQRLVAGLDHQARHPRLERPQKRLESMAAWGSSCHGKGWSGKEGRVWMPAAALSRGR